MKVAHKSHLLSFEVLKPMKEYSRQIRNMARAMDVVKSIPLFHSIAKQLDALSRIRNPLEANRTSEIEANKCYAPIEETMTQYPQRYAFR